jgi:FMN phosphatase YigB (HAD superfamily)
MPDMPRIPARNVLLDIDGTVVTSRRDAGGDTFARVLEQLVAARRGIAPADARRIVRSAYDPERECVSCALRPLGVDEQDYLAELLPALKEITSVYADAAEAMKTLRSRGFVLFPATTNSGFAIFAKLACDGANQALPSCFSSLLGGGEVHPEGKSGPGFYRALIGRLGIDPGATVMVGDDPRADLLFARQAGISSVVIVRRSQAADWVRGEDGGIYVRSLALLDGILELQ